MVTRPLAAPLAPSRRVLVHVLRMFGAPSPNRHPSNIPDVPSHPAEGAEHKIASINDFCCRCSFFLSGFHLFHAFPPLSSLPPLSFPPQPPSLRRASSGPPPPSSPLARSCKWLPANGLSEEKTDLNEERRQKGEQRGGKRRCTQRGLEMHGVLCVLGSLSWGVGRGPTLEGNPLPRRHRRDVSDESITGMRMLC